MRNYSCQLLIIILSFLAIFPFFVQALEIDNPLEAETFAELFDSIISIIFTLGLWAAAIMIIVAGFYFLTAAGNPAQVNTAKGIIMWTLIGLIIIMAARGAVILLIDYFHIG